MSSKKGDSSRLFIGTSGWSYEHWKDNFYPEGLKLSAWLNYYAGVFPTVEINNTFYRMPKAETVKGWYEQVPEGFLFSIKASRYISHIKRLKDCEDSVEYLLSTLKNMKEKLGPILIQLSPSFKMNKERLIDFIACLEEGNRYVFEFRHPTWFVDEIYSILAEKDMALCITDLNGTLSPEVITASFTYIRLHGPKKAYQGTYGKEGIKEWKHRIDGWLPKTSVFCYFDNDEKGYAVKDAKLLLEAFSQ